MPLCCLGPLAYLITVASSLLGGGIYSLIGIPLDIPWLAGLCGACGSVLGVGTCGSVLGVGVGVGACGMGALAFAVGAPILCLGLPLGALGICAPSLGLCGIGVLGLPLGLYAIGAPTLLGALSEIPLGIN